MEDVDARPAAPIPMPSPRSQRRIAERVGERLGVFVRRVEMDSRRVAELLRAARTEEGRRRNVVPLAVLVAVAGLILGAGVGMWRGQHGRAR